MGCVSGGVDVMVIIVSLVGWTKLDIVVPSSVSGSQVMAPSSPSPLTVALLGYVGVDLGGGRVDLGGSAVAV